MSTQHFSRMKSADTRNNKSK